MNFGHATYVITTLIFAGIAISIEWLFSFRRLAGHKRIVIGISVLGVLAALVGEPVALSWKAWAYNDERIMGIFALGTVLETVLFGILVGIAISSATLVWSDWEDEGLPIVRTTFLKLKQKVSRFLG